MKTKKVFKIFVMVLAFMTMILSLTGCLRFQHAKFEKGFSYTLSPDPIMMGVRAETDVFEIDDVTLDLYYGFFDIEYCERYDVNPLQMYKKEATDKVLFVLYICKSEAESPFIIDEKILNYKEVDNHFFIKEITEAVAGTTDYGYLLSPVNGVEYCHSEKITIPEEIFAGTKSFSLKIIPFNVHHLPNGDVEYFVSPVVGKIETFLFTMTNEQKIKITF